MSLAEQELHNGIKAGDGLTVGLINVLTDSSLKNKYCPLLTLKLFHNSMSFSCYAPKFDILLNDGNQITDGNHLLP